MNSNYVDVEYSNWSFADVKLVAVIAHKGEGMLENNIW